MRCLECDYTYDSVGSWVQVRNPSHFPAHWWNPFVLQDDQPTDFDRFGWAQPFGPWLQRRQIFGVPPTPDVLENFLCLLPVVEPVVWDR